MHEQLELAPLTLLLNQDRRGLTGLDGGSREPIQRQKKQRSERHAAPARLPPDGPSTQDSVYPVGDAPPTRPREGDAHGPESSGPRGTAGARSQSTTRPAGSSCGSGDGFIEHLANALELLGVDVVGVGDIDAEGVAVNRVAKIFL